nr:4Fe-4S dicluster domain-containing protein [uncultured Desulfobacter sp.]
MKLRLLKPLRVCIAMAFFLPTVFLFLDVWETGARALTEELLFLQFVPSTLKFLNHPAAGSAGFIFVLITTFMFGRIYCSAICPLGVLQDLVSRLFSNRTKTRGKKKWLGRYQYSAPQSILRYTVLIATLLLFFSGSGLLLNLLDPFSGFGRIFSNLFRPFVIFLNNLATPVAEALGIHALYRVQWPSYAPVALGVALVSLGAVGWMSTRHGRLYCNTLCPVGTLLGLISKFSLVKINFDIGSCRSCGRCEQVCKSKCIDVKTKSVDTGRCVSCFNCLSACPDQAMMFQADFQQSRQRRQRNEAARDRRNFVLALVAGGLGITGGRAHASPETLPVQARPTTIPENKTSPLSPPGSVSIARYTTICTACHLCVSACPSRVLVPSVFSFGLSGMMQPRMDFNAGHCNYDCTVCSNICPSGAILPLTVEEKQQTQVGVAKFIKENCVVYTDNTNCGACSEHCPSKAVHMKPYLNAVGRKLVIPEVDETICVGCGGCEHACPTKPFKAIYVDGNPKHKTAQKPKEKKIEMDAGEDFPF